MFVTFLASKLNFPKNSFRNIFRVSNGLGQDQDQHSVGLKIVGPDLGPYCLQRSSTDNKLHC